MSALQTPPAPGQEPVVEAACGGKIPLTPETHFVIYQGEIVYLCGQGCKLLYEADPLSSCLAGRILSGK